MSVGAICNRNVATIEPDADITDAAERMRTEHVGDLIVARQEQDRVVPLGIITDRDIVVSVIAKKVELEALKVSDVMSDELLTVREDDEIEAALQEMRRFVVRRAPVVDADGQLVGVLSISDVVDHLAKQFGYVSGIIRFGQTAEAERRP